MNNQNLIIKTIEFKERLRQELKINHPGEEMNFLLWKVLIATEIAHRSFALNVDIEPFEESYFDRQAAVGRYFCDWGLDWVAEGYFLINEKIMDDHFPKEII